MPWIAVDKNGMEAIFQFRPVRSEILERFLPLYSYSMTLPLPKGSAKKLIGEIIVITVLILINADQVKVLKSVKHFLIKK